GAAPRGDLAPRVRVSGAGNGSARRSVLRAVAMPCFLCHRARLGVSNPGAHLAMGSGDAALGCARLSPRLRLRAPPGPLREVSEPEGPGTADRYPGMHAISYTCGKPAGLICVKAASVRRVTLDYQASRSGRRDDHRAVRHRGDPMSLQMVLSSIQRYEHLLET